MSKQTSVQREGSPVIVPTDDGVDLAVVDCGPRHAEHELVLSHGWCLDKTSWDPPIQHLRRRYGNRIRILTYDHRGHGNSTSAPMSTYQPERLAADLGHVLSALNVNRPIIGGHSLGAMVALTYAGLPKSSRTVHPAGLALIAAAGGRLTERGLGRLLAAPGLGLLAELVNHAPHRAADDVIRTLVRPACELIARARRLCSAERAALATAVVEAVRTAELATAVGYLKFLREYSTLATLSSITVPTVVLSGGLDLLTPVAHAHELADGIPGAIHHHLPQAGHMLLCEAPRAVADAIDTVITRSTAAAPLPADLLFATPALEAL
ncbi:alpha/beta fold hydrolase [Mycobacterium sp. NPDC003449]